MLSHRLAIPFVLLSLLSFAVYWQGLDGGFIFDDHASILGNPGLRAFDGSLSSLIAASQGDLSSPLGRPVSMASFALNYYFTGEAPFHFKLTNLLIHLLTGGLTFLLMRLFWQRLVPDARSDWGAFWVTAIWMLHPINLTPVLFVVQRMTGLSALLTLAALWCYCDGRERPGLARWARYCAGFLLIWPSAVLAKETALLLPVFVLLCEWLVFDGFRQRSHTWRRNGLLTIILVVGIGLGYFWPLINQTYLMRDFSLAERVLTEMRVLWFYVMQMLVPWPDWFSLHHDDIGLSRGLFSPPLTAVAMLGWIVVLAIAWWQRHVRPWLTFAIGWYLGGHLLESSVLGLEIAYEHRNYVPSLGIFMAVMAALLPTRSTNTGRLARITLVIAFAAYCALTTGLRAAQWGDEYIRTQIESNTHPHSARTHYEAAKAILARTLHTGEISSPAYHMARTHFLRASEFDPFSKAATAGILFLDCAVGMPGDRTVLAELQQRLAHTPFRLGDQAFVQGLSDMLVDNLLCLEQQEALQLLDLALANPGVEGRLRGMLYAVAMDFAAARLGSLPKAREYASAAVASDPGSGVLRVNLIRVLLLLGETDEAKRHYAVLSHLKIPASLRGEVENLGLGLAN